jgi:hypothetical protein
LKKKKSKNWPLRDWIVSRSTTARSTRTCKVVCQAAAGLLMWKLVGRWWHAVNS